MRKLVIVMLAAFASLAAENFDADADAQILNCARSTEFCLVKLDYNFEGTLYPVAMLHNPAGEKLTTEGLNYPQTWSLALMADLPFELALHLTDLIPELKVNRADYSVDFKGHQEIPLALFTALRPVPTYTREDDPQADAEIQELFHSTTFVNKVFHYRLGNRDYRVRILHNPEGRSLTATRGYYLEAEDNLQNIPITWNYRYGIFTDYPAPQKLIDHLCALATDCSWWNWCFNFQVENGTRVVHVISGWSTNTIYYLDSWFVYTRDLR